MAAFDIGAPRIRPLGRQFAQTKVDPRVNNGTTAGGLAYVLQNAMSGYEKRKDNERVEKDEQDFTDAQSALVSGLKGEPALDAPLPEGISGPVRPELPGGFDAAAAELALLEGNPYAGRLASQLLMANAQQQAEAQRQEQAWARDDARYQQTRQDRLSDTEADRAFRLEMFNRQQASRPAPQRQIVKAADGFQYYTDTGERVIPGAQAPEPARWDNLSPGQEAMDKEFAKELAEFSAGGGFADAEKNAEQLRGVLTRLESVADGTSDENLSGPILGGQPDVITAFTNPAAISAREEVEEVVQRNLRVVLGAQFTEKEGDKLIARAYNPRLSEAENAKRVKRLLGAVDQGLAAKKAAANYFQEYGTLNGYQGPTNISRQDIESAIEGGGGTAPPDVDPALWGAMTPEERALWTD